MFPTLTRVSNNMNGIDTKLCILGFHQIQIDVLSLRMRAFLGINIYRVHGKMSFCSKASSKVFQVAKGIFLFKDQFRLVYFVGPTFDFSLLSCVRKEGCVFCWWFFIDNIQFIGENWRCSLAKEYVFWYTWIHNYNLYILLVFLLLLQDMLQTGMPLQSLLWKNQMHRFELFENSHLA